MIKDIKLVLKDLNQHKYIYVLRASILQFLMTTIGAYLLALLLKVVLINSNIPGMATDNLLSFLTNPPVSYTHLDVYKRQCYYR